MTPKQILAGKTRAFVRVAEIAVAQPRVQARTPTAKGVRECLIRQIWWGDRVLAQLRDGADAADAMNHLKLNISDGLLALKTLNRKAQTK